MHGPTPDPSKWISPPGNSPAWICTKTFAAAVAITAIVFAALLAWAGWRTWNGEQRRIMDQPPAELAE